MDRILILNQNKRKSGSYYRKDFIGDIVYNSFYYREFQINFAKKGRKNTSLTDDTASFLYEKGLVSKEMLQQYYDSTSSLFTLETIADFDEWSIEELYAFLSQKRESFFGKEVLSKARILKARESKPLSFGEGIDQTSHIRSMCQEKSTLFVALTEPELFAAAKEVLGPLKKKRLVFLSV